MDYIIERPDLVLDVAIEHVYITIVAILGATLIGVALGVLITRVRALYDPILTVAGIIYTIPSLAMFVLMIPILGIGFDSAVVALILYSLLVIIRNTAVGIDGVDPNIIEAARGMGMTSLGILLRVELPLALPVVFAGIRIASVSAISIATIAAFIGAGGIGDLLFQGISSQRNDKIVAGAIAASVMAIGAEILLQQIEKGASPGLSGDFRTLGEHLADFWAYLRNHPDTLVLLGAVILLVGYFGVTWVTPYADDPKIADDPAAQDALAEAGYTLGMTGFDLAQFPGNAPIRQSLQLLPWFAGAAAALALANMLWIPRSRASSEVLLLCGLLAFFPLVHFYAETRRAIGELGTKSDFFLIVRNDIRSIAGVNVSPRLESLDPQGGFTLALIGAALVVVGAYLKSLWFRRRAREVEEQFA
jgi:osmoprotectant transport system permease protein